MHEVPKSSRHHAGPDTAVAKPGMSVVTPAFAHALRSLQSICYKAAPLLQLGGGGAQHTRFAGIGKAIISILLRALSQCPSFLCPSMA